MMTNLQFKYPFKLKTAKRQLKMFERTSLRTFLYSSQQIIYKSLFSSVTLAVMVYPSTSLVMACLIPDFRHQPSNWPTH